MEVKNTNMYKSIETGLFGNNLAVVEWEHKAVAIEVSGGARVGAHGAAPVAAFAAAAAVPRSLVNIE